MFVYPSVRSSSTALGCTPSSRRILIRFLSKEVVMRSGHETWSCRRDPVLVYSTEARPGILAHHLLKSFRSFSPVLDWEQA
jgi:hypothetical protein